MACKPIPWKSEYKINFLLSLRDFELTKVIFFADDLITPIIHFVTSLLSLEVNISRYEDYYWKIKKLLTGYINCCQNLTERVSTIGSIIPELDKAQFLNYISKIRNWQSKKQSKFTEEMSLVILDTQKENIEIKFEEFIKDLDDIEAKVIKFDRIDRYLCFLQEQYEATLTWLDDLYEYAADHIAFMIHKENKSVKESIEENYNIHFNNVKKIKEEHEGMLDRLRLDIYEKKKIWLHLSRDTCATKQEIYEAEKSIKSAEKKFQDFQTYKSSGLQELEREKEYYGNCLQSFEEICGKIQQIEKVCQKIHDIKHQTIKMYEKKRENIEENENLDGAVKKIELDFIDTNWNKFMSEYSFQSKHFQTKLSIAKKPLITFFFVKGQTRTMCLDDIAKFYFDEYGRKIYSKHFGMKEYNVEPDGDLKRLRQGMNYAYDDNGHYIEHASKMNNERALDSRKIQKESEQLKTEGKKELNRTEVTALAKGALSREDVNYLWDALDPILSRAMHDVAKVQSTNYIFNLAHRLITLKYGSNYEQLQRGKEEAIEYREKIYADRREKKIRASETWKSQLMKKPRPADFEDDHSNPTYFNMRDRCVYVAHNNLN